MTIKPNLTYRTLRDEATTQTRSRLESEILLTAAFGRDRAWMFAHLDDTVQDQAAEQRFHDLVRYRAQGTPVAYLLGEREFYGRAFRVNPAVLIPRPETELLIDCALQLELPSTAMTIDVGTGSGCIALTLAAERPGWSVMASDISKKALDVAGENRRALELDHVILIQSDLLDAVSDQRFDLIVSNPPYVACSDPHLTRGDLRFEPSRALTSGNDGLTLIRRLISQAADQLNAQGWLMIEHGYDQAGAVRQLMNGVGFNSVHSARDLAGIERVCIGRRPGKGGIPQS